MVGLAQTNGRLAGTAGHPRPALCRRLGTDAIPESLEHFGGRPRASCLARMTLSAPAWFASKNWFLISIALLGALTGSFAAFTWQQKTEWHGQNLQQNWFKRSFWENCHWHFYTMSLTKADVMCRKLQIRTWEGKMGHLHCCFASIVSYLWDSMTTKCASLLNLDTMLGCKLKVPPNSPNCNLKKHCQLRKTSKFLVVWFKLNP